MSSRRFRIRRRIRKLEGTCGIDLSDGHLRIEYTQDTTGFWLEPHTDISVKLFTMLVYRLEGTGTGPMPEPTSSTRT